MGKRKKKNKLNSNTTPHEVETNPTPPSEPTDAPASVPKSTKVRTTVTLHPETLIQLDLLKIHARQTGEKATYSNILRDAIELLVETKGIKR